MSIRRRPLRLAVAAAFVAAATLGLPGTPAQARPAHVAIYVAGVGTACAAAGTDGLTALESRYDVTIGQPGRPTVGMVLFIDGVGANTNKPNYWSYWHWSKGRWQYAGSGPAGYDPPAGTSDGWAFGHFGSNDQPPLPAANYTGLCGSRDPNPPPPSSSPHSHSSTPATSRPATAQRSSTSAPVSPGRPSTRSGSTASAPPRSRTAGASSGPTGADPAGTDSASTGPADAVPDAGPASGSDAIGLGPAPPKAGPTQRSGLPPWGTVLAFVVIAAFGGAAVWQTRRQGRGQP